MSTNLLNLQDPRAYNCNIWGYVLGHSSMYIEVYADGNYAEKFYVLFSHVLHFEGRMKWRGANFQFGSPEEEQVLFIRHFGEKYGKEHFILSHAIHLYVVGADDAEVKILAGGLYVSDSSEKPLSCQLAKLPWRSVHSPPQISETDVTEPG